ncbi:protein disulfide isomerase pTAC5, chloroplastic [Rhododendron vialii]|uniref:protein disulfide isomerase pTAC5, chloroplastic n=1 Tax=Rhododendron vialii TaxID=182163 RepID=UPI00265E542A|nr:protein disulfide isomerase pTAC5, chloroplastic [Rhododendron vialii]
MSLSSSLPLPFNPTLFPRSPHPPPLLPDPNNLSAFPISKASPNHSLSRPLVCFSLSSSSSNYEQEEARWLREEQRWLREEQRWLRQESQWLAERDSLLREIKTLKLRIQELEGRQGEIQGVSVSEALSKLAALLQVVKEENFGTTVNRLTESGSSAVPMVIEAATAEEAVVVKEVAGVGKKEVNKKKATLRKGSEGEDVRAMQEALQKLGFYPGEEDLEYSSFSSGTERAVKTWQATLGAPEDGIMTAELQERLYMEHQLGSSGLAVNTIPKGIGMAGLPKEAANGAAFASITEISEIQKTIVEEGVADVEVSEHRVFLLGENRWEEPSRLTGRNKQGGTISKDSKTKCLTCRGEGRVLCTECDGSGEPNVEPQFMEWIDEGTKCPYCEGHGFTICDVCEGKTLV